MKTHIIWPVTLLLCTALYCSTWVYVEGRADDVMRDTIREGCPTGTVS